MNTLNLTQDELNAIRLLNHADSIEISRGLSKEEENLRDMISLYSNVSFA